MLPLLSSTSTTDSGTRSEGSPALEASRKYETSCLTPFS